MPSNFHLRISRLLHDNFGIDFEQLWLHAQSRSLWANLLGDAEWLDDEITLEDTVVKPPCLLEPTTERIHRDNLMYTVKQIVSAIQPSNLGGGETPLDSKRLRAEDLPSVRADKLVWSLDPDQRRNEVKAVVALIEPLLTERSDTMLFFECAWITGCRILTEDGQIDVCNKLTAASSEWTECWENLHKEPDDASASSALFNKFGLSMADCNALCLVEALRHDVFGSLSPKEHEDNTALKVSYIVGLLIFCCDLPLPYDQRVHRSCGLRMFFFSPRSLIAHSKILAFNAYAGTLKRD